MNAINHNSFRSVMKHLTFLYLISMSSTTAAFPRHAAKILQNAKHQIQRRPALAHGVVGFGLFGASDALAQRIESTQRENRTGKESSSSSSSLSLVAFSLEDFDTKRILAAGIIGAFFGGGVYPFAYKHLDRLWKGNDLLSIAKKSLVEVFTVGVFANSVSMATRGVLVGKDPHQVIDHVKKEMPEVTLNDLGVWFPYNMIAFGVIPPIIRPTT